MNFYFDHDGRTYAKHSECSAPIGTAALGPIPAGERARVVFDLASQRREEPIPLEPSGDDE